MREVTAITANARAKAVSALEALHLFTVAETITAPIRVPIGRRNLGRFYKPFVHAGELVFDIGANVGEYTQVLLELGARVVSVEPQSECVAALRRRFDDQITVVPMAVSDTSGQADLILNEISNERATLSREHSTHGRFSRGWGATRQVPVTTLDALIAEHGLPALCKIDVETLEAAVLRGLSQPIATVIFEYHEGFAGTAECVARLDALGKYAFNYRIGRSPRLALAQWVSSSQVMRSLFAVSRPIYGDVVASLHH